MRQTIREGLGLAEQLAALPFKAMREALPERERPWGDLVRESITIGEGLTRLPFKAAAAVLSSADPTTSSLEQRVTELERRLGVAPPDGPG